jgi:hypothetical protein
MFAACNADVETCKFLVNVENVSIMGEGRTVRS